jgi:hypothetical protein
MEGTATSSRKIIPSNTALGTMRFRKLRIAWSVGCGIACVLLIVWWMRSYWYREGWIYESPGRHQVLSQLGVCYFGRSGGYSTKWFSDAVATRRQPIMYYLANGGISRDSVAVPYWFSFLIAGALTTAPWIFQIPWRFSLRTLLITTTLVAVVLGLIVAVLRWPAG